jgi:uncharacterized protein with HEPN domain
MRDDSVYLEYIGESIGLIQEYLGTARYQGEDALFRDLRTQDAILRRMETLSEATTHLSDELKARYPEIDWRKIADFRNRLAHGYVELRLDLVWDTIVNDLPALQALIEQERKAG